MLFNMQLTGLIVVALAPFLSTAGIVNLYADTACTKFTQEINVKDNTCANWPSLGWASYKLTKKGGPGQIITSYPKNVCVYPGIKGSCVDASDTFLGSCLRTVGKDGTSHAIGSSLFDFCEK